MKDTLWQIRLVIRGVHFWKIVCADDWEEHDISCRDRDG